MGWREDAHSATPPEQASKPGNTAVIDHVVAMARRDLDADSSAVNFRREMNSAFAWPLNA